MQPDLLSLAIQRLDALPAPPDGGAWQDGVNAARQLLEELKREQIDAALGKYEGAEWEEYLRLVDEAREEAR